MYMIPVVTDDDQGPYIRAFSVLLRNSEEQIQEGAPSNTWEEFICTSNSRKETERTIRTAYQDFVVVSIREIQVRIWDEKNEE